MKRIISFVLIAVMLFFTLTSCAEKFYPEIKINTENVTSVEFKKTYFEDDGTRVHKQKKITDSDDIEAVADWLSDLRLTEHSAIEIPVEKISYVMIINGKKVHRVIFMDEFIIYDSTAYTFDNEKDLNAVQEKYDLLGYTEEETELDLI